MSDQPEPRQERPEPKTGPVRYSVPDAARLLGISERAVRKRITAGTLVGFLSGRSYVVELPDPTAPVPEPGPARSGTGPEQQRARAAQDRTSGSELVAAKDDMIAAQRQEIEFLRDQLDQKNREQAAERERFDVIHREALHRIEALTAGDADEPATMPQDASPTAPGATEAGAMGQESLSEPSHVASWLRRIFGRS
jgi:hypothetical protein